MFKLSKTLIVKGNLTIARCKRLSRAEILPFRPAIREGRRLYLKEVKEIMIARKQHKKVIAS